MLIELTLHFPKGYIGHPYWPEMEKLINIQKGSGVNRARSEDKRAKTLKAYLDTHGLTMEDYRALEVAAARPFYTRPDGEIVIPAHHLHGLMAMTASLAPGSIRLARPDQVRNLVEWSDLRTGKMKPDGVWERFATVSSGTGQRLSNQRGFPSNAYIQDVHATGTLRLTNPESQKKVREFTAWGGEEVGVGASRKMGWGRFTIEQWGES